MIKVQNGFASFRTDYSDRMFQDVTEIANEIRQQTREAGVKYDTIVGRGSSGMLIVPVLARILRKKFLVVRKDEEVASSHSTGSRVLGDLGKRWIFVDDFCSSGKTFRETRRGVEDAVRDANNVYISDRWDENLRRWVKPERETIETELVGWFEYQAGRSDSGFHRWHEDELARPGYSDFYWDDTPWFESEKAKREAAEAAVQKARGEQLQREADEAREAELNRSVITVPNEAYQAEYGKILQRITCGLRDCEICEAEAKAEAERTLGELKLPATDENRRPIPATLEELMSNG